MRTRLLGMFLSFFWVVEVGLDCGLHGGRVVHPNQFAGFPDPQGFFRTRRGGGNDWAATSHGFDQYQTEAFAFRGMDKHMGALIPRHQVFLLSGKVAVFMQAKALGFGFPR